MVFSSEWEEAYKRNMYLCNWPDTQLIGLTMHYAKPVNKDFSVLEIGCGSGPNIPFFITLGVRYYGIEGSRTMAEYLRKKYPSLKRNIICGDFTEDIPFKNKFDLVVDRSSLTHNSSDSIKKCLGMIHDKLKPDGKFIGIDWFSTSHSEYSNGRAFLNDPYTKTGFKNGRFSNVGIVHFSDKRHLEQLLDRFKIISLTRNDHKNEIPQDDFILSTWNFVVKKK